MSERKTCFMVTIQLCCYFALAKVRVKYQQKENDTSKENCMAVPFKKKTFEWLSV